MTAGTSALKGNEEVYLVVRTRSIFACAIHWIVFCSVIVLAVTGLYIGNPTFYFGKGEPYQAFAMADMRFYHFTAAAVLIASFLTRFYLAFTDSCNKDIKQFLPTPRNVINAFKLAFNYGLGGGKHLAYRYVNPLGGIGIFGMIVFITMLAGTGLLMYAQGGNPNSFWYSLCSSLTIMIGGIQNVRVIHHLSMYFLFFTVIIHIYMQIWKNIVFTESDISSIIGGYKIFPYRDIGHFADYYGIHLDDAPPSREEMDRASTPMKDAE